MAEALTKLHYLTGNETGSLDFYLKTNCKCCKKNVTMNVYLGFKKTFLLDVLQSSDPSFSSSLIRVQQKHLNM